MLLTEKKSIPLVWKLHNSHAGCAEGKSKQVGYVARFGYGGSYGETYSKLITS